MTETNPGPPAPAGKRRRWTKRLAAGLVVLGLLVVAAVAAIPWGLATPPGQRWLLRGANRALAPGGGRIAWQSIGLSWFGPTRVTAVVLRDAQGDPVITAPRATLDRTLWQLLFDRPRLGTLELERAAIDAERRPDGTVDLYETIKPILRFDPRTHVKIVVPQGRLRFRAPPLAEPLAGDPADITLEIGPAPRPISWKLDLKRSSFSPPGRAGDASLAITGHYDRWWEREPVKAPKNVALALVGRRWPWAVEDGQLAAQGILDGTLSAARQSGRWSFAGNTTIEEFEAAAPALAGDRLRLARLAGSWDIERTPGSWLIRRLDLTSPVATLKTSGPLPAPEGASSRVEATVDLAALAQQVPHLLRIREGIVLERGTATVTADSRADAWEVEARVSELRARDGERAFTLESPATLSAHLRERSKTWAVERLAVRTAFLDVLAEGDLDAGIGWTARLDLEGLQRQLRSLVDFGRLELAGKGSATGGYRRQGADYTANLTASLRDLHVGGLSTGPIDRTEVILDGALDGPADRLGLPRDWASLRLALRSDPLTAKLTASARGDNRQAKLSIESPLTLNDRNGRLEGGLTARWNQAGAAIDGARLALVPGNREAPGKPMEIIADGNYDRAQGLLVLTPRAPAAGGSPAAIALGPDGLRIAGIGTPGALRVDASLVGELAALSQAAGSWGQPLPADLAGPYAARALVQQADHDWNVGGRLDVFEPARTPASSGRAALAPRAALRLALKARYEPKRDRVDLDEVVLASTYASLEASGQLSDLSASRRIDLMGKFSPDWDAINRLLRERIEPGARIAGRARPFRVQGTFDQDHFKGLDGELGVDLTEVNVFGMSLGKTPVVVRAREGRLRLDPIDTTLNQGRLHVEPEIVLDDPAGALVRLGPESSVHDARINDEVSHRVLAFAAPVLDNATRARGRVSVRLKEAVLPLGGGPERAQRTSVTGAVLFQDAEFVPGPIVDQLFDLIGLANRPSIKLDEPVSLTIANRRVYQRGLTIPIGDLNVITMEGWVDFDRRLALKASVPLLPTMWRGRPDRPVLNDLFGGLRITVPIGGTLDKPELDRDAFNVAMQDLGKSLLERTAGRGAAELLQRLFQPPPRDPNAPPPLTPEERRARRQQRREDRRMPQ